MWSTVILLYTITSVTLGNNFSSAKEVIDTKKFERLVTTFRNILVSEYNLTSAHDMELLEKGKKSEDIHLSIEQLIVKYGYSVLRYEVITEDGYILTLHRIPSSGRPVLMMHGILLSSDDWVTPGPESGLAYLLAAEGLDVWLGNARGNKHSRKHLSLSQHSEEFWDFSFDEIGRYDLPAIIDHILNMTQYSQLLYVGHSQGTTIFYVMGSERPEYTKKISLMIAMAPAAAIPNIRSPFFLFLKYITNFQPQILFALARKLGFNEFYPPYGVMKVFQSLVCGNTELAKVICINVMFLLSGFSYSQLNITNLFVQFAHSPAGASLKQFEHYTQIMTSNKFKKFDYGALKNVIIYGSKTPPEYNVRKINTPMAIFYAENDLLTTELDVLNLRKKLNNVIDFYKIPNKTFNHVDFVHGIGIKVLILPKLMEHFNNFKHNMT